VVEGSEGCKVWEGGILSSAAGLILSVQSNQFVQSKTQIVQSNT